MALWGRALIGASALWASSCGAHDAPMAEHTLDAPHVVDGSGVDFHRRDTTAQRFGLSTTPAQHASAPNADHGTASALAWDTPAGWTETAASSMRVASFRPGADPRADCYLTLLPGDAGGLAANVNRWRAQLSLAPLSAEEIEGLPRAEFLGHRAALVDATGTWKGMSGAESSAGWRLLGLLLVDPTGSAFLKMVGPEETVAAQRDAFLGLARSFHAPSAVAHGDEISTAPDSSGGFAFDVPLGWRRAPEKLSRAVSLFAGSTDDLECYVTVFPGDAGGLLANVNRWRGQLGVPEITEADLSQLEHTTLLDHDASVVDCSGQGKRLVAVACVSLNRSVFVKMSGPEGPVGAQREAFRAFCASLRDAR